MSAEVRYRFDKTQKAMDLAFEHTRRLYLGKHTPGYSRANLDDDIDKAHAAIMAAQANLEDLQRSSGT